MQCLAQAAGTCLYTADWSLEAFQQVHTTAQAGHARQSAQRRFNFVPLGLGGRNVTLPRKLCNADKFITAITVMPATHSALLFAGHAHKPGRYKTWANHKHVATGSHNGSCTKGDFHQSPCLYMEVQRLRVEHIGPGRRADAAPVATPCGHSRIGPARFVFKRLRRCCTGALP